MLFVCVMCLVYPVATLAVLRFCVGFGSAVTTPGLAAAIAQMLPVSARPQAMSRAYGAFLTAQFSWCNTAAMM